jgi:hypothetical protein
VTIGGRIPEIGGKKVAIGGGILKNEGGILSNIRSTPPVTPRNEGSLLLQRDASFLSMTNRVEL